MVPMEIAERKGCKTGVGKVFSAKLVVDSAEGLERTG